jgi:hypothetical protein
MTAPVGRWLRLTSTHCALLPGPFRTLAQRVPLVGVALVGGPGEGAGRALAAQDDDTEPYCTRWASAPIPAGAFGRQPDRAWLSLPDHLIPEI